MGKTIKIKMDCLIQCVIVLLCIHSVMYTLSIHIYNSHWCHIAPASSLYKGPSLFHRIISTTTTTTKWCTFSFLPRSSSLCITHLCLLFLLFTASDLICLTFISSFIPLDSICCELYAFLYHLHSQKLAIMLPLYQMSLVVQQNP